MSDKQIPLAIRLTGDGRELRGEFVLTGDELDKIKEKVKETSDETKNMGKSAKELFSHLTSLKSIIATIGIGVLAREVYQAGVAMDGYNSALKAATGSQEAANQQFKFARDEANRLGLNVQALVSEYTKMIAASRGTAIEGESTRKIFTAVAEASRVMNLSMQDTQGMLNAIQQMMSKGNVQAEELRGQLGERLPGAFQMAAKALNVTTAELNNMLDRGEVLATDLLPRLADEIQKSIAGGLADAQNSPAAEMARLKNEIFELEVAVARSGFLSFVSSVVSGLREAVDLASELAKSLQDTTDSPLTGIAAMEAEVAAKIGRLNAKDDEWSKTAKKTYFWDSDNKRRNADLAEIEREMQSLRIGIVNDMRLINQAYAKTVDVVHETIMTVEEFYSEASAGASEYILKLNQQVHAVGLNKSETILYAAAIEMSKEENAAAASEIWSSAQALAAQTAAFDNTNKAAREHARIMAEGKRIYENTRTDAEKFANQLIRIQQIYEAGGFGKVGSDGAVDTLRRASAQAQGVYETALEASVEIEAAYKAVANGIHQVFSTAFEEIFTKGVDGFENLFSRVLRIGSGVAAQISSNFVSGALGLTKSVVSPSMGIAGIAAGIGLGIIQNKIDQDKRKEEEKARERVEMEKKIYEAAMDRYKAELSAIEGILRTTETLIGRFNSLRETVRSDIDRVSGRSNALLPSDVQTIASHLHVGGAGTLKDQLAELDQLTGGVANASINLQKAKRLKELANKDDSSLTKSQSKEFSDLINWFHETTGGAYGLAYAKKDRWNTAFTGQRETVASKGLSAYINDQLDTLKVAPDKIDKLLESFNGEFDALVTNIEGGMKTLQDAREGVLAYYDAQKKLNELMVGTAKDIQNNLVGIFRANMNPVARYSDMYSEFTSIASLAKNASGADLAGYGSQLNQLANPLLSEARGLYASGGDYQTVFNMVTETLSSIKDRLINDAPDMATIEQQTVSALESIDGTLVSLGTVLEAVKTELINSSSTNEALLKRVESLSDNINLTVQIDGNEVTSTVNNNNTSRQVKNDQPSPPPPQPAFISGNNFYTGWSHL